MTFPPGILWDCSGSPDTQQYVEIKMPTISQQRAVHQLVGPEATMGISTECKTKDKTLDGQPAAYGHVVGSYQHPQTGSEIDFGP